MAVLADVGQPVYHVGDEAMGHAAVEQLTSRGVDVVMLSRNPSQTRELYGTESARTIVFPWPPLDRERYLEEISLVLQGQSDILPPDDQVWDIIRVIEECDAVLIAGGGNMNSGYGWLLYERAAVGLIAAHFGRPLVISGQTFGPALTAKDSEVLAELLKSARLVEARESASHRLALELGVLPEKLVAGLDDAAFFAQPGQPRRGQEPYIAATFSPGTGTLGQTEYFEGIAAVLDELAEASGLGIVFIPHMANTEASDQDLMAHRSIVEAMRTKDTKQAALLSAAEAAALTAGASMVVTSRYHPVVFATGVGIPVVSLSPDHYSDARLTGALANWGLAPFNLPLGALLDGNFRAAALAVWEQRADIRAHLLGVADQCRAESHEWWDAVVIHLRGERLLAPPSLAALETYAGSTDWFVQTEAARRICSHLGADAAIAQLELQREQGLRQHAAWERDEARAEVERLTGSKAFRAAAGVWKIASKLKAGKRP